MRDFTTLCVRCRHRTDFPAYRCPACAGPLVLELAPVAAADCRPTAGRGLWRYAGMLPRTGHAVTLGEGATPLLPLRREDLPAGATGPVVYAKLESVNPSLSFKDRAMALAASAALDHGLDGLVLASTGNAAVSAATYAAAAGLRCRVFCATGSNAAGKLDTARAHGAEVELVDGDYSDAYRAATRAEGQGWLNVTTTYRNPLLAEAYRPVAAELVEELGGVPEVVVVPVGAGPLLRGIWLGFTDLRAAGLTQTLPRMVGVQAAACAPLARAWGAPDWAASLREPVEVGPTSAAAIADALRGYQDEGLLTLAAARDSGGSIVAVTEPAIAAAGHRLAHQGLFVEPAAAASVAALDRAGPASGAAGLATGMTGPALGAASPAETGGSPSRVVAVLTGHGAKEPSSHTVRSQT
ncbi:pyridoxal-phosphate dependent enzyme [Solwaraspora sp. WMMD1047]|uniref:pyridoxal-phosphate dependent enzyme n=1 Tax=Solwaraspora sp. WMMD1047 TaxID=3016102 RepID=UPI002417F860|nr:pyridoxal-phosphate dependent enzyme [Solwaraspora sp. WMMD1047]MDG4832794.1 pyridoxal-phosphate dependent enzyme [Solwaraspora sp. WMMD1047]